MCCFFITTVGWFAWNAFLSGVYAPSPSGPYAIRDTFTNTWGRDATWWATVFIVLALLGLMDISIMIVKRNLRIVGMLNWPPWKRGAWLGDGVCQPGDLHMKVWQELEQDPDIRVQLKRMAREGDFEDEEDEEDADDDYLSTSFDGIIDVNATTNSTTPKGMISSQLDKLRRMIPIRT